MWVPDPKRVVKVVLHDRGDDVEAPWAEDLGPDPADPARRLLRIGNVPFFHAKPTYEDVVSAARDPARGMWSWDRAGAPFERVPALLHEDSGRWAMILDWRLKADMPLQDAFRALDLAGEQREISVEGAYEDDDKRGGRAFAAAPREMSVAGALAALRSADLPVELTLVHPTPDE